MAGTRWRRRTRKRNRLLLRGGLAAGLAAGACVDEGDAMMPRDNAPIAGSGVEDVTTGGTGVAGTGAAGMGTGGVAGTASLQPVPITQSPFDTPTAVDMFAEQRVVNAMPATRVLYSWTTDEQIAQLRQDEVLLLRTERPGLGGGLIRQEIMALADAGDPLSKALTRPEFQTARYAWPNPWATLLGWESESYGDNLIRIALREDAWVMTLIAGQWQMFDMDNNLVPRADAIDHPERIGAIFHMHESDEYLACSGSFIAGGAGSFREFFLPNEAMVEEWSIETPEIRERLEADLADIQAYRAYVEADPGYRYGPFETAAICVWEEQLHPSGRVSPDTGYLYSLAIAGSLYDWNPPSLARLEAALEAALFEPNPLRVKPGGM